MGWGLRIVLSAFVAATPGLRQFHVVFPEGFTRAQMIQRVAYVANKADSELKTSRVTLSPAAYDKASLHEIVPCFGKGVQKNMEGYLVPGEVRLRRDDARREHFVQNQIAAFCTEVGASSTSRTRARRT